MKKSHIFTLLIFITCLPLTSWAGSFVLAQDSVAQPDSVERRTLVRFETTSGNFTIALFNDTPIHRDNFIKLVSEHFYDSLLFHRTIWEFMIQTGDPTSRHAKPGEKLGEGTVGYTLPAEIHYPKYFHRRGMVAAAREGDEKNPKWESDGSQFYIVQDENGCLHLDGQYTIFGEVIEGLDVIDKIAAVETDYQSRPLRDIIIESIRPVQTEPIQKDTTTVADSVAKDSTAASGTTVLPETRHIKE